MIQFIARKIHDGGYSAAELAASVGLSQEQLKNRLDLMERQGYLVRENECGQVDSGSGCCSSCPSCSDKDRAILPVQYHLTEKGELLARSGTSRT
jgi:predicted ArsR family transcriptional regulator